MAGQTTLRPATWANQASLFCEWSGRDASSGGEANHDGARYLPPIKELCRHIDDLVETTGNEIRELHLYNRLITEKTGTDRNSYRSTFGNWRIEDPIGPPLVQSSCRPERSFEYTDVLSHQYNPGIGIHLIDQGLMNGLDIGRFAIRFRYLGTCTIGFASGLLTSRVG